MSWRAIQVDHGDGVKRRAEVDLEVTRVEDYHPDPKRPQRQALVAMRCACCTSCWAYPDRGYLCQAGGPFNGYVDAG